MTDSYGAPDVCSPHIVFQTGVRDYDSSIGRCEERGETTMSTSEDTTQLFRALVEQGPDAVIYADREGMIRVWNRAAETLFGYTAAEVLGKSLDVIIPERFRAAHWAGFDKALETGRTKYEGRALRTRSAHKDGNTLYVDLSFGLIRDPAGVVIGAVATGRVSAERPGSGSPGAGSG